MKECPVCGKLYLTNGLGNHLFKQKDEGHLNFVNKIEKAIENAFYEDISCTELSQQLSEKYRISISHGFICKRWMKIRGYDKRKHRVKSLSLNRYYEKNRVKILEKYPYLKKEWDYDKNELSPEKYTFNSNKKVWWKCEKGHSWDSSPNSRSKGHGCPYCSGNKITLKESLLFKFPELCKEWDYDRNKITPEQCRPKSNKNVWWKCKNGHNWKSYIPVRTSGHGCPFCDGQRPTKENNLLIHFPKINMFWDYDKNKNKPEDYLPNSGKEIWWKCNKGHSFKLKIQKFVQRKSKCLICSNKVANKKYNLLVSYPELCEEWDYDKNMSRPEEHTPFSKKCVWWTCKNNHSWAAAIGNRSSGNTQCPICSRGSISLSCIKWLDELNILPQNREVRINKYFVDGLQNNVVYEYLGDFWHGNPNIYKPHDVNNVNKKTFGELLYNTISRFNVISKEYKIIYKWESESKEKVYNPVYLSINKLLKVASVFYNKGHDILEELC